jgi:two-component system LytT family response regulator
MKALLVDDEQHGRENLKILLQRHCPEVNQIETAVSVDSAVERLKNYSPDILFLDVQMPGKDGFHLLNEVDTSDMSIIFVTAHDEYALRAIKCGPTAYILKPIDVDDLKEAVGLAVEQRSTRYQSQPNYKNAIQQLTSSLNDGKSPDKICLSHTSKLQIINISDIVLVSSDSYYSIFHLKDKKKIVISKTLKYYEEILGSDFLRVHRSHLVNINCIQEFLYENSTVTLNNNMKVPVSRRKINDVVERLKAMA